MLKTKSITNLGKDDTITKEVMDMKKDIPVSSEIKLRNSMCLALFVECAIAQIETTDRDYSEITTELLEKGSMLIRNGYVSNSFVVLLSTELSKLKLRQTNIKERVKTRFCHNSNINPALATFSDPSLSVSAKKIQSGTEQLHNCEMLNATVDVVLNDVVSEMSKLVELPHEFVSTLK